MCMVPATMFMPCVSNLIHVSLQLSGEPNTVTDAANVIEMVWSYRPDGKEGRPEEQEDADAFLIQLANVLVS